jgi:hypothetical protein
MAVSVEWEIKGTEFANCNCIYACPCQFNALPDKGFCEAVAGYQIHQGHFGDVPLDGLRAAAIWHWPGAVHEGNGSMQLIIDERADANQRDALVKILSGQETEDMATVWWVFGTMSPTKHGPSSIPLPSTSMWTPAARGSMFQASCSRPASRSVTRSPARNIAFVSISRRASSSLRPRSPAAPVRSAAQSRST